MRRCHMVASGRVQAVGFRYTVFMLADKLGITGWVRNKHDGTVEMQIQGKAEDVAAFIENVKRGPGFAEVDHLSVEELAPVEEERGFDIRMDE